MPSDAARDEALVAGALWRARDTGTAIAALPDGLLKDRAAAYRLQKAVTNASGLPIAGWKIGAIWNQTQALLGLDGPFAGPIPENGIRASGTKLDAPKTPLLLELEIALRLAGDISPQMPRTGMADAIGSIAPAFEVVSRRIEGPPNGQGLSFIADGGVHWTTVLGEDQPVSAYDPDGPVTLRLPDGEASDTVAASAHGWPDLIAPLAWLAQELDGIGQKLRRGQIVMIGTITLPLPIQDEGVYRGEIAGLGPVTLKLSR